MILKLHRKKFLFLHSGPGEVVKAARFESCKLVPLSSLQVSMKQYVFPLLTKIEYCGEPL